MKNLDLTLSSPEQNIALDESLLDFADKNPNEEILRFWTPLSTFVVLGFSKKRLNETHVNFCQTNGIPILRRASGGGTVLQAPGCLNYALVLSLISRPELKHVKNTNCFVLKKLEEMFNQSNLPYGHSILKVKSNGHTDLTVNNKKFSGNAQRRKKNAVLFHGTILLNMDLNLIQKFLPIPDDIPDYRQKRSHEEFVTNLHLNENKIKEMFINYWDASEETEIWPKESVEELVLNKYSKKEWNEKF